MKQINQLVRKYRELSLLLLDSFSVCVSYILAFIVRSIDLGFHSFVKYGEHFASLIRFLPLVLLINWFFLYIFKVNRSLWKYISLDEVGRIVAASVLSNCIWFYIVIVLPVLPYIRSLPVIAALLQIMIMLGIRFAYRWYRNRVLTAGKSKNTLIIGAGNAGDILLRDLISNDQYECRVIGFIDDNQQKVGKRIAGVEILGTTEDLSKVVEQKNVECIYIAMPSASRKRIAEIVQMCSSLNVKVYVMDFKFKTDVNETVLRDVSIEDLLGRDEVVLDSHSVSEFLTGKRVMITGAGGSIGSELCRQIVGFKPKEMILVDIYENNMYTLQQDLIMGQRRGNVDSSIKITCLLGSVREKKRVSEIMAEYKPQVVFHAAAHKHVPLVEDSPCEAIKNNIFGTKNVLESSIENKVEKFILISTDKAVNPTNIMGATKRVCELMVQANKENNTTIVGAVRFGNVLGSNGSVIPLFKEQIKAGGPITVTDPGITRYFMTIPEAARLVLQAGAYASHGDIFVLDMGTPVKILKLAESMISLSGLKPYEDIQIEFIGLRPGEKMYEELSLGNEKRYKTANDLVYVNESMDISKEELLKELDILKELSSSNETEASNYLMSLIEKYK